MKKIILTLAIIVLSGVVSTNISFAQWNKVNEHFELQRAKNTKILSYTTYEEDNNLVVIDESGEINEYKMDTGELTKACNCIKDSTFEYAKVLEDKETVVLGKKYWDTTKYGKAKFYQFELFLLNKNKCEFLTQSKIPLDSTVYHLSLDDNYGVSIPIYKLEMFFVSLNNNILTVNLNKEYRRDVDFGKPSYSEQVKGEKIIFNFDGIQLIYKDYKRSDKLIINNHFYNSDIKYGEIYYYDTYYSSLSVQTSRKLYNGVNIIDYKDSVKTILSSGTSSSSSSSTAGGYWSKHEGQFQDMYQILESSNDSIIYIRMKDSLMVYNFKQKKYYTSFKSSIFNQFLFTNAKPNLFFGVYENIISFYNWNTLNFVDKLVLNKDISNYFYNINSNNLFATNKDTLLIKINLKEQVGQFPKYGYNISENISYTDKEVILRPYTNEKGCEFIWTIDGLEYKTNELEYKHIFEKPGIFDIKLKIITSNGETYEYEKKQIIEIREKLVADFDFEIDEINPFLVNFINKSSGNNLTYKWIINDSIIYSKNSSFDFVFKGDFKATLIISDNNRKEEINKYIVLHSNIIEFKQPLIIKDSPFFLKINNFSQIFKADSSFLFYNRFSTKADDSDLFYRYWENYGFQYYDLSMTFRNNGSVCGSMSFEDIRDESKFSQIGFNKFIFKKSLCQYEEQPYQIYEFQNADFLENGVLRTQPFLTDFLENTNISYHTNNRDRLYSVNHLISNFKLKISSSDKEYNTINSIEYRTNYFLTLFKVQTDKILFLRFESNKFVLDIYDKDLKNELQQEIYYKDILTDSLKINWRGIGNFDNENIYLYGTITENNVNYGCVCKLNYINNTFDSKILYSRENLTDLQKLNNKYFIAIGNTRSNQGYMILDNNLNIINDLRYNNLAGKLRNVWIDEDNIYMFSGDLNYAYDKIDERIMLSVENNYDNTEISQALIFPNPSSDKISIDLGGVAVADLVIYDILGNEIISIPNYANKSEIDISNLSIGTYTIQVQTSTGSISQRLLVNR